MDAARERIEPLLCFALAEAERGNWRAADDALRACRDYAELHRAPVHTEYNAVEMIERLVRTFGDRVEYAGGSAAPAAGDADQIAVAARAVLSSAVIEHDAALRVEVLELDGVPVWRFAIDGPGRFADCVLFGCGLSAGASELESAWTCATRGGRIDARPGQLDLRLKGVRAIPERPTGCGPIIEALRAAEARARLLASGEFAPDNAGVLREAIGELLAGFDAEDDPPQPCDIAALVRSAMPAVSVQVDAVTFTANVAPGMPPVPVRRNRIARMFDSVHALGRAALTHGGEVRCDIEYTAETRALSLAITGEGRVDRAAAERYLPAIARAAAAHDGEAEFDVGGGGFLALLTLPDGVARALDAWLPGWDTFAARSVQMLRLLKSGGPAPPEELILGGVLEDELERRLLPRLGVAPAATLVHDLGPRSPALCAASPARIEKVMSQLKRGKPKKEICAPPYAAEILWMFAIDARHAAAVGIMPGRADEVQPLCRAMAAASFDLVDALRAVARVLAPPDA